jgi:SAM-dependent methyltransferase
MEPMPSKKELDLLYSTVWDSSFGFIRTSGIRTFLLRLGSNLHNRMQAQNRYKFLSKNFQLKGKKVLEIGCAKGDLIKRISKSSITKCIEPSKESEIAESRGIEVLSKNISKITEDFDIILIFMVLEHVSDPIDELTEIRKKLRKGGFLILEVPNTPDPNGLGEPVLQGVFNNVHTFHFSRDSLKRIALKAGFRKLHMEYIAPRKPLGQNIYDLYPVEGRGKNFIKQLMILSGALFIILIHLLGGSTNSPVKSYSREWRGSGNWLRLMAK